MIDEEALKKRAIKRRKLVSDIYNSLIQDLDDVPDLLSTVGLLLVHSLSMCDFPENAIDAYLAKMKDGVLILNKALKKGKENGHKRSTK
jgi:hypothetical protein